MSTIGNIKKISKYYAIVKNNKIIIALVETRDEATTYIKGNPDLTIRENKLFSYE